MDLVRLDLDALTTVTLAKEVQWRVCQIPALTLEEAETADGVRR